MWSFLSCAGLPDEATRNNGVFISEGGRKGRRGKRHKNSTNLADGKLQPLPSETEIAEAGRSHSHESTRGKACTVHCAEPCSSFRVVFKGCSIYLVMHVVCKCLQLYNIQLFMIA